MGKIYHCSGDLLKAEEEYRKLLEAEERTVHLWGRELLAALFLSRGMLGESEIWLKQGIEFAKKIDEKVSKPRLHLYLAYRFLKSGHHEEALKECNKAGNSAVEGENLSQQRLALHYKGLAYLGMKSIDGALRTAEELKEMIEKGMNRKVIRRYHHLMGSIELERQNFPGAIEYFNKAISLLPFQHNRRAQHFRNYHALFIDSLAFAYYKAGDSEKAKEEYERITNLTTGRLFYGDIYAKSFYMLGKIYEQKGWKVKAIEHYQKFLDLWKDADPGIAEVEDARERLAELQTK
jgi:tetratricopeptide (TPR) repeat protein